MKNFDLAAAKKGANVCTRDGREARILCFDLKGDKYPILAALYDLDDVERVYGYDQSGKFWDDGYNPGQRDFDLMMADDDYLEKLERGEYDHIGEPTEKVDWEYWRRMYAGMAIQAIIQADPQELAYNHAQYAVTAADALIEELKKKK